MNIKKELQQKTEPETLQSIPEDSNSFLSMPDPYMYQPHKPKKKKTEKITQFFADKDNQFNFMSKSNFDLSLKGMVNMSSVQYNQFDFFQHGDEYLNYQMVNFLFSNFIL